MLAYSALIEEAKTRRMPHTKIRGILREYLQVLILKEINRNRLGKKLLFTGGTYLRLVHNIKRFSEDLDFNTKEITRKQFEDLTSSVQKELKRLGLNARLEFTHWQNIYASKIIFPEIEQIYQVSSKHSKKKGIVIKLETNSPKWQVETKAHTVSGYGELYPCICTEKSALFADKIDALNKKQRARHLYDIIFMLSNQYPINKDVLKYYNIKQDPLQVIQERVNSFSNSQLKKQAEAIRPFLFDEEEASLIINAKDVASSLVERYKKHIQ